MHDPLDIALWPDRQSTLSSTCTVTKGIIIIIYMCSTPPRVDVLRDFLSPSLPSSQALSFQLHKLQVLIRESSRRIEELEHDPP